METAMDVLEYLTLGVFATLAVVSLIRWLRWKAPGAGWVAAAFSVIAGVAVLGLVFPEDPQGIVVWVERASIAALLLFPYFLYRFTTAIVRPSRATDVLSLGLVAVAVVWSFLVPIPPEDEAVTGAVRWFLIVLLVEWTVLSVIVAVRLWRAGRGEPTPARRRLRLLSAASVALNVTIVVAGTASGGDTEVLGFLVQILALASLLLFFVALFPPRFLRLSWRRPEEAEFRQAIGKLMRARRREDVVASLLPHIRVVAGQRATLLDERGHVIGDGDAAPAAGVGEAEGSVEAGAAGPDVLRLSLRSGSLLVRPSPYSPLFGHDELVLLETLGALADLALERVDAEQTMRDQAELLDLAPDAIFAREIDGRINYWNEGASRCYGYTAEEALGRVSHDLLATKFPVPRALIEEELVQTGRWQGELVQNRKDGQEIVVASRWALRTDAQGRPVQVLVINVDITEQKRAARELEAAKEEAERANQAKSQFLSRMSHELRTPLNAILGFSQLLELRDLDEEERDNVSEITRGGRHLLELINEVLEISRIEAGRLAISLEAVPVHDLVAETMSLIRPLAEQRGLQLRYEEAGCGGQHVLGDLQRLKQVLLNLLSNAVKYNVEGGSVHLSCGLSSEDTLRISVSDTGRGIPPDRHDKLFEPFERLGAEQGTEEGTGLGLALSKRLIEAMGGAIGMESTPGEGSVFWFEVRLAEDPSAGMELSEGGVDGDGHARRTRASRTALYIEDNLSNLKLIQGVLARRPEVRLIAAMHGRMGLDLARQHQPDVILLDLQLPDMSGGEILGVLKADPSTRSIPVVVISADATRGQVQNLMAAGAHAYLTKPLDVQRFLEVLDGQASD
jgi:PAS domain S-box-containing protein